MSLRRNLIELTFALALTLALNVRYGQTQETQVTVEAAEPAPIQLPLYQNEHDDKSLPSDRQTSNRPPFLKLLLERLEKRKMDDNSSLLKSDFLTLQIRDGTGNIVSLEFAPNTWTPEKEEVWSNILNLLATNLAHVIQEAERQGFSSDFKYSISLSDFPSFATPAISTIALKSAAG